jgi:hypothetical protein
VSRAHPPCGFIDISEAAYGNAENWEKVLGWLDDYLDSSEEIMGKEKE